MISNNIDRVTVDGRATVACIVSDHRAQQVGTVHSMKMSVCFLLKSSLDPLVRGTGLQSRFSIILFKHRNSPRTMSD